MQEAVLQELVSVSKTLNVPSAIDTFHVHNQLWNSSHALKLMSSKRSLLPMLSPSHALPLLALYQRYRSKKKAFSKSSDSWKDTSGGSQAIDENFNKIKKYCKFVRAICHTQVSIVFVIII